MPQMTLRIPLPHLQIRTGNGGEMEDRRHGKRASWATWASPGYLTSVTSSCWGMWNYNFSLSPALGLVPNSRATRDGSLLSCYTKLICSFRQRWLLCIRSPLSKTSKVILGPTGRGSPASLHVMVRGQAPALLRAGSQALPRKECR